jgi:membrane-associated phospholipid phosphatase
LIYDKKMKAKRFTLCYVPSAAAMKTSSTYLFILLFPFFANAQRVDTVQTQKGKSFKPFIIPAVFIGYGLVSLSNNNAIRKFDLRITNEIKENSPNYFTRADDVYRYVPALAVYGLNLAGIKGKHSLADATGIYLLTTGISGGLVISIKHISNRTRPDGSDDHSFPSGHSATAFASAEFLNQEYRDVSPWYGYAGYTVATATATLRLYNKKHFLSDVIAGAGFGILSAKASYLLYPKIKEAIVGKGGKNYSFVPIYQDRTVGFAFNAFL